MAEDRNVYIVDSLEGLSSGAHGDCLVHALCTGGNCRFVFNGKQFELSKQDLMIIRRGKLVESVEPCDDFRIKVFYAKPSFIELSVPQNNYGMKGQLALFLNPVMHLTAEQYELCCRDFDTLSFRLKQENHHFHRDILINAVQTLIIDFYDFHSHLYKQSDVSTQSAAVMNGFIRMLENGEYRVHREVSYYADCLCVTSKYLSEVSKKLSGYAANFWINRYTILDISRLLRNKSLSFVQISDMFGFSSPAYFSRYVQNHLGVNPSDYRR